jgi:hypothetical protein
MSRYAPILAVLMVCCCLSGFASTISLLPTTSTVGLGTPVALNVSVAGLSDLYAFQFDITFSPAVLSAAAVTEGSLFSSIGVAFSPGSIDNTAGAITFIGDSLSGPGPGISTDGTLATIMFNSIGAGTSAVDLSNVVLLDSALDNISANSSGATINVTGVPEPSTRPLLVIATGAISVAALRKRLRRRRT